MRVCLVVLGSILALSLPAAGQSAGGNRFSVSGDQVQFNGTAFKVIGLRTSNALISDAATQSLIDNLNVYMSYGVNTVSVFFMGSRFGDIKGYRPDASLDPTYTARMGRIIEAADSRGMIVLVGCLYWSTSRAKEDLGGWKQADANNAVANTVRWLKNNNYRNVFVDPDNEGMAHDATGWSIKSMIDAAHAVDPTIMVGYNDSDPPPSNADLYLHHSPRVSGAPWIQSEGSAPSTPGGYWGSYSKETHQKNGYYNYSRIGRYTSEMKSAQISKAKSDIANRNGYIMASTWIQCAPFEGVGGPFHAPGGRSNIADVDKDIDTLHPDAGILWWLEGMKSTYGAWNPPAPGGGGGGGGTGDAFLEQAGTLVVEAEHFDTKSPSTYSNYSQVHHWELKTDKGGYSSDGFMQILPDERGEDANGPSSPRDNSGAEMTYPIRISTAGTYNVWVRGWSMGGESNGIHLGVDGALAGTGPGASNMSGFRPHNQWVWENGRKDGYAQPATITLTAGDHTLNIWNRDDGFRIDKVVLTTSSTAPSGQGPAESPRSGGGGGGGGGSAQAVTSLTLINADTDQPIAGYDPIEDGATLNLATLPTRNVSIRANTSPSTVGSVRFSYDGTANYQTESTAPYAIAGDDPQGDYNPWTPATGAHTLTATPYTGSGATGTAGTALTITFTVIDQAGNQPPIVAITAPADGASFTAPASITLQATASDPDGSVSFVEFFQGGTSLGTDMMSPYSITWNNVASGTYTIVAEATDNGAVTVASASITITVTTGGGGGGSPQAVTAFTLINADTDLPVPGFDPILDGSTLNLGTLPSRNLNFLIHTSPATVGSVGLGFDGNANYRTENNPPYTFAGDTGGSFDPWTPAVGPHTIIATPYTGANRSGTAGTSLTFSFTVLDDPTTPSTNGPGGGSGGGSGGGNGGTGNGSRSSGGACGATGIEALILGGLLLLLRRLTSAA